MPTSISLRNMIIEENLTIKDAMALIDKNSQNVVFVVDRNNKMVGIVTDGDLRRALLAGSELDNRLSLIMNKNYQWLPEGTRYEDALDGIGSECRTIPILNAIGEVVDCFFFAIHSRIPIASPILKGNEFRYVFECLSTNWISSQGKFVNQFESEFAKYLGVKYAVATSSGTTALHLALAALGIKGPDKVIVPTLTFIATANAVTYTGATPVFADSERETWNISPRDIERKITPEVKAIIPVHLYGQPAQMDEIMAIARKHNLYVIEDAAEAHGAEYKKQKVGTLGDIGVFSFFGNKILTTGEGGMLVTNDDAICRKARILRDHGMSPEKKYWHQEIGFNYRLTNIQAAIGCAQLEQIEVFLQEKQRIRDTYTYYLRENKNIILPPLHAWARNVNWLFSIVLDQKFDAAHRDKLLDLLKKNNVECRPFFYPIHQMPPYHSHETLKEAEWLAANGLCLPSYVGIREEAIKAICEILLRSIN